MTRLRLLSAAAALFTLGLVGLEWRMLGTPYGPFLRALSGVSDATERPMLLPAVLLLLVLSAAWSGLFVWAALRSGGRWRAVYGVVFVVAVSVQYAYAAVIEGFARPIDLRLFQTSRGGTMAALAPVFADWRPLIPAAAFLLLLFRIRPPERAAGARLALLVAASAFGFFSLVFPISAAEFPAPALSAFARTLTYQFWIGRLEYHGPREPVPYRSPARPDGNVLLILDESIRADHLSVNGYPRPTTPRLEALAARGRLTTWGTAAAGATQSLGASALLLTGVRTLPDDDYRTQRWPTAFQFARAMGYRTLLFDGGGNTLWGLTRDDGGYVDEWINADSVGWHDGTDILFARLLAERLRETTGQFVVVRKRGAHVPYDQAYPAELARWTPVAGDLPYDRIPRDRLVNSYDNAIRHVVDGFFQILLGDRRVLDTTVVLYTADHGQTLKENGATWTHTRHTRSEAAVPMLLIADPMPPLDTGYRASHVNVLPTLLDLMAFPETERPYDYAPSLLDARAEDSRDRFYMVGRLHTRVRWLTELVNPGRTLAVNFDAPGRD